MGKLLRHGCTKSTLMLVDIALLPGQVTTLKCKCNSMYRRYRDQPTG